MPRRSARRSGAGARSLCPRAFLRITRTSSPGAGSPRRCASPGFFPSSPRRCCSDKLSAVKRREFLNLAALVSLPTSLALAQQAGKVWRIGFFYGGSRQSALETGRFQAFVQGMRELGYVENKNYVLVDRYTEGVVRAVEDFAKELLDAKLDVIVTSGGVQAQALKRLTGTAPIVVVVTVDPIGQGLAETMARPGRNFTGLSAVLTDIFPKPLGLL